MRKTNKMHINAGFNSFFNESVVWQILQEFEGVLISLSTDASSNPLESFAPSLRSDSIITEREPYIDDDDDDAETLGDFRDEELEGRLRDVASRFLEVSSDNLDADSSLISLGLDSIKSIGLSRALEADGLEISAVGLMKHSSICRIARYLRSSSAESSAADLVYTANAAEILEARRREIAANVNIRDLQLSRDDSVDVFPTTDIQSGMLSQVCAI